MKFSERNLDVVEDVLADDYQQAAMKTCSVSEDEGDMLLHGVFGLASEAGEVAGIFQKYYQGHPVSHERIVEECGDCLWMIAEILAALDVPMSSCMRGNIEKLRARYPEGFDPKRSLYRG